jgi:hypothetical protein
MDVEQRREKEEVDAEHSDDGPRIELIKASSKPIDCVTADQDATTPQRHHEPMQRLIVREDEAANDEGGAKGGDD